MNHQEPVWDWVRIILVVLLILTASGILIISIGVFDPKPRGNNDEIFTLSTVRVNSLSTQPQWLAEPEIARYATLRLSAGLLQGEVDSSYGLVIGTFSNWVVIALSPTGYLTIQHNQNAEWPVEIDPILPWQLWPHVNQGKAINEIWVDVEEGRITAVRINRELLSKDQIQLDGNNVGLMASSFGEPATIDFQKLEYFWRE